MCPLPGNVPDWLGLHWGGNTQLHWRQPCQLLQDENGTEHLTLTLCCCVRCFSHACDPCNKCSISSSIYSFWDLVVDTFDFYVIFYNFLQISHIIREIRQFQQTAYKIDYQPKVKLLFICIVLQLSVSCLDLSSIAIWGVLKKELAVARPLSSYTASVPLGLLLILDRFLKVLFQSNPNFVWRTITGDETFFFNIHMVVQCEVMP